MICELHIGGRIIGAMDGEISVEVGFPLDLRRTLRPLGGSFADDGWWLTARTPAGPATLHLRRSREAVQGRAWGEGGDWLLKRVSGVIGENDRPTDLVSQHRLVANLVRRHQGYRFGSTSLVMQALVRAVVEQKVTGKEAHRSLRGLVGRFSDPAPGPRPLRLPPDPERLAAAPYWDYHRVGIERRRAETLRRLAADWGRIEAMATMTADQARRRLEAYPGVGRWTSAKTVAVTHGDADAVAVGDFHFKNVVAWHLAARPRGTDDEMLGLLEPFRPHRGRVIRLLETVGHPPAFGPRVALRSIADR